LADPGLTAVDVGRLGAKHTLAIEDAEMDDPAVTAALAAAARRGMHVTITMTADSEWDQAFTELARAGADIRLYPDKASALYIHAKAIVADAGRSGQRVLVGSQSFSVASLGYNRELGSAASPRKRFVNSFTSRFRGNARSWLICT
jgi:cardiolipin synthase